MPEKSEPIDVSSMCGFPDELREAMARSAPLTPLDEAYIAHADALCALVCRAIAGFPLKPRTSDEAGSTLLDALELKRLADAVVEGAVVVERERGASWTSFGQAADGTKQSALQRWADVGHLWTLHGCQRVAAHGSLAHARTMDAGLTTANPMSPAPCVVTSGLAAASPRGIIEQQASGLERSSVQSLYQRLDELSRESEAAYGAWFDAIDTDHHTVTQQRWAALHLAAAEVCGELAAAEPTIADNHQRAAARHRAIADDILSVGTAKQVVR
ncbi:hypothetical protein [Streptomyces chartreusis]|uniref:hypothetical protein n=1 Tax=Streptomyces chartreusis TaxID=1969 RepID=UPI002F90DAA0|nr:hypothetical protein OG938_46665 [Streptomyces chartreusis]WTA33545.1 hypothetical protein OIA45_47120 [Streptomyces chartreusis]